MKKIKIILIIGLLLVSNMYGGTIKNNIEKITNSNVILFVKGLRVYNLFNEVDDTGHHYIVASKEETWDGVKTEDIPRLCAYSISSAKSEEAYETMVNLFNSIPESRGKFVKLNSILSSIRMNNNITELFLKYSLTHDKGNSVLVGEEIMKYQPEKYMQFRDIVDDIAPEMSNIFELSFVWLGSRQNSIGIDNLDPNRSVQQ